MSHWREIEEIASDNHGYFTAASAREVGVLSCELDRWMKTNRLESPARGVYRLANYPPSDMDPYVWAAMAVGKGSFVYGESVIAMLNLVPTDPTVICIGSPARVRRKLPAGLEVVCCAADVGVVRYEGVPSQSLADAIRSSRGRVRHDRRVRAAEEGFRQGYYGKAEYEKLKGELKREVAS